MRSRTSSPPSPRKSPSTTPRKKELERLQEELADGKFDSTDWEAADALDKTLDKQAAEAQAELSTRGAGREESRRRDGLGVELRGETSREREELERALMNLSDGRGEGCRPGASAGARLRGPAGW